jgi:hypothetical protein
VAKRKPRPKEGPTKGLAAPKRGRGRPTKFTGEDLATFLGEIEIGNSIISAASVVNWSPALVYAELKRGRQQEKRGDKGKARDFLERYRVARARAESHYVRIVAAGAAGDKEAKRAPDTADAKFMLKVINPGRYRDEKKTDPAEKPISRIELAQAFKLLAQSVQLEVEDDRVLLRIGERWREIFRTLGMEDETDGVVERRHHIGIVPKERRLNP